VSDKQTQLHLVQKYNVIHDDCTSKVLTNVNKNVCYT